jgi:hypothetical protein
MSRVTGVTLLTHCIEELNWLRKCNEWLVANGHSRGLIQVDSFYGGTKTPQQNIYGAGLNYLQIEEFAAFVRSLPWEYPENVLLVLAPEDEQPLVFRMSEEANTP